METKQVIPQWLVITGQSGSGKGTVLEMLKQWYQRLEIPVLSISTGDLVRACIAQGTYLSEKMESINRRGLAQPPAIASSLWTKHLFSFLQPNQYILHEGSPRSGKELEDMLSLVSSGYIASLKILEVKATEEQCAVRLAERTRRDKRIDLSKDGSPGVPDSEKIATKLGWWRNNRLAIIDAAINANMYQSVQNIDTLKSLQNNLMECGYLL